jgi:hypothetical protein
VAAHGAGEQRRRHADAERLGLARPILILSLQRLHFGCRHSHEREKAPCLQSDLVCLRRRP